MICGVHPDDSMDASILAYALAGETSWLSWDAKDCIHEVEIVSSELHASLYNWKHGKLQELQSSVAEVEALQQICARPFDQIRA